MLGNLDCYGITDVGRKRESNQDQFLIADLQRSMHLHYTSLGLDHQTRLFGSSQGKLLLVADGMGGHAAGERASSLAVDCVVEYLLNTTQSLFRAHEHNPDDHAFGEDLKAAFRHCQEKFSHEIETMPNRHGMGTTLTLAYIVWPRLYVVHAGDSRAYLLRGSHFERVTRDHTLAQEFVDMGHLSREEAENSRFSHVLWNAIGGATIDVQPDFHKGELRFGDTLLLCTDGLTRHLEDDDISELLLADRPARDVCEVLVEAANSRGGSDNITVIVARFEETHGASREANRRAADIADSRQGRTSDSTPPAGDPAQEFAPGV